MNQTNKKGTVTVTLFSAVMFCLLPVIGSLSPFAETGPNANSFNSAGMWTSVGMMLVFYLIPLALYVLGVNVMKIIMAVFCGIGLIIWLAVILVTLAIGMNEGQELSSFSGVLAWSGAAFIVNVLWYVVAFRAAPHRQQTM
ncbi:DUF5391 family protein [Bacillus sp. ISL-51]|uniref:DUF5391 family protein n=1 Tax=Bacteria TaxID=2 RepID=UPI001BEC1502|nr:MULTISPECIES: DUF5391 family protein [Bacteria]MBT2574958.1 DUF5391 family protein [Bacillus sp. ISL-51]MBT2634201.1 DUF5391 family protein [Bacillus sp. ISL-26]MBT2713768.1 DUF5391 family protein [Pseudomonas sp. ISL-88]